MLPRRSRERLTAFIDGHADAGVLGVYRTEAEMPAIRGRIAAFIGARASEVGILRNTGDGANVVATGMRFEPGDRVVLPADEFPSNAIPWLALRERGVDVHLVRERLTPDALRAAMNDRTRVVAVSWVNFADGYRHDLAALGSVARDGGALFCVDAIQGLGAFPIDVASLPIDVLYAGGAKWMLSLQGVSFVYVREAVMERVGLGMPGWRSMRDMWDFLNYDQPYLDDASRFEGGTPNFIGALSLDCAVALFTESSPPAIAEHVLALTDRLVEGLQRLGARIASERGPGISSGIVTFQMDGRDSVALGRAIQHAGGVTTWRPSGIRVAPHGYTSFDDIDHFVEMVKTCSTR